MNHRVKYKPIEVGDRFGRLVVIGFLGEEYESGTTQFYWLCSCDCGEATRKRDANLKSGNSRSCGCLQRELAQRSDWKIKHGDTSNRQETPEYRAWQGMFRRVDHPDTDSKKRRYSERGIKVCSGLRGSYGLFLRLLGRKPVGLFSLDRTDNNGNYSCGVCDECIGRNWDFNLRWATAKQQAGNAVRRNQWTGPAL